MLNEKTRVFILENENNFIENPDVRPYRCSYCGIPAIIERETLPEGAEVTSMPHATYCDCLDATTEVSLKKEISDLHSQLASKSNLLNNHTVTKVFDNDTHQMRYEDAVISLKKQFGITT